MRRLRLVFLLAAVLPLGILLAVGVNFWLSSRPADQALPESAPLRAHIPSLGRLLEQWLSLEAADLVLTVYDLGEIKELLRGLRSSGLLRNPFLRFLTDVPLYLAFEEQALMVFDLGWRGLFLQPALWLVRLLGGEGSPLTASWPFWRLNAGETTFFLAVRSNLLLVSPREELLDLGLTLLDGHPPSSRAREFFRTEDPRIKILLSPEALIGPLAEQDWHVASLAEKIRWPSEITLAFSLDNHALAGDSAVEIQPLTPALSALAAHRPPALSLLRVIPTEAVSWTLLNWGPWPLLLDVLLEFQPSFLPGFREAQRATRLLLGLDLEEILAWNDGQVGAFLLRGSDDPVLACTVADPPALQRVVDTLERSLLLSSSERLLIDNIPVTRLRLPSLLTFLLEIFEIRIELPYYALHDGVLYLSQDAGSLTRAIRALREGKTLDPEKTGLDLAGDSPPRMLGSYDARREPPFFALGPGLLSRILRLYPMGIATISATNERLEARVRAQRPRDREFRALPGFPRPAQGRPTSRVWPVQLEGRAGADLVYIADGNRVVIDGLQVERVTSRELPEGAWVWPLHPLTRSPGLWGVTTQGLVQRWNADLQLAPGFPLRLSSRISVPPFAWGERLVVFLDNVGQFAMITPTGSLDLWPHRFEDPVLHSPAGTARRLAVATRALNGELLVFQEDGTLEQGSVGFEGLSAGSPVWLRWEAQVRVFVLTVQGELYGWGQGLEPLPDFPVALGTTYQAAPVLHRGRDRSQVIALLSRDGLLTLVRGDGSIAREVRIPRPSPDARLSCLDLTGDEVEEIVIYGHGDTLLVYDADLRLIGEPRGYGEPSAFDVDGDRVPELITTDLDGLIHAWSFR